MEQLAAHAWSRHGLRRLYVKTGDGNTVGWVDLVTGKTHLEDPLLLERFEAAVAEWQSRNGNPVPGQRRKAAPVRDLGDLAENLPGAAARTHARRLREQAPVRTFLARMFGVRTEERSWRIGADGEELVGTELGRLDVRWRSLHAIRVGTQEADIDHLVVGPSGVHTLNTKHHPGGRIWVTRNHIRVNGHPVHWIRNARHEAERAALLLSTAAGTAVPVTPIVVVVGARRLTFKDNPRGVLIVPVQELRLHLETEPVVLSGLSVDHIYSVARRPRTWLEN